jgi:hypothetical protein
VWWLQFKAEVCNKQGFTDFWSAASTCSAQHHASVLSILSQIILDNQAKTKLLRFLSSDDPQRGRRVVDALLATFLPSPKFRSAILNQAMYRRMQRAEDLTDYDNRLNLARMELEQLMKPPDESTLVVAFIQGLRVEFKTAAQLLSTGTVDAFTLDDVVQHVRDSMLIASAPVEQHVYAFLAEVTRSPSSENVVHDAIVAQLSTLTAQMKSLTDSVAAMVASSSRPSSEGARRHLIRCSYCDKRGHTEAECYQRQHDIKRNTDAVASFENVVVAALAPPPPPPIAGALWALPAYVSPPLLLESELDISFVSADVWFIDSYLVSNPVPAGVFHLYGPLMMSSTMSRKMVMA